MESSAPSKAAKKLSVEKIYQKKTQLEHILLRPDTYVGSMERLEQEMWVWDFEAERMQKKEIQYVPGLFKIFDEILGLSNLYTTFMICYILNMNKKFSQRCRQHGQRF